jgi:hypothetical protein
MSARRFTDKPDLSPETVLSLDESHPAMRENRTLFPSTVVTVTASEPASLLVSGHSNRKLGKTIEKGRFAGYALYQLSLEERATCSEGCHARAFCYGNNMHMARRHRIGDPEIFFSRLEEEIKALAAQNIGVMIRLHVLGDFPSVEYVGFWVDILSTYENVAIYGYTARLPSELGEGEADIGDAIESVKRQFGERFRIRWSFPMAVDDGATVADEIPARSSFEDEDSGVKCFVCPAQTDATACCATCGLCWHNDGDCVVFVKHGRTRSAEDPEPDIALSTIAASEPPPVHAGPPTRQVAALALPPRTTRARIGDPPEARLVSPRSLYIEDAYQRRLSGKSKRLIFKIVAEWDWAKFKPPICAETPDGLFVIDGQHTAIAAATHGCIPLIPVVVTKTDLQQHRAAAFVAHNRDRVAMTPYDIFYGELAAGSGAAAAIQKIATEAGCVIPRYQPQKLQAKPGTITAVNEMMVIYKGAGPARLEKIMRILGSSKLTPITALPMRALRRMFDAEAYAGWRGNYSDAEIAAAISSIPGLDLAARAYGVKTGQDAQRACIMLIKEALEGRRAA